MIVTGLLTARIRQSPSQPSIFSQHSWSARTAVPCPTIVTGGGFNVDTDSGDDDPEPVAFPGTEGLVRDEAMGCRLSRSVLLHE
jgi:hypothetical protein